MTIVFREKGPSITSAEVDAFEATLPGSLPTDYRSFLLSQNGGWSPGNWWPPEVPGPNFSPQVFYSLGEVDEVDALDRQRTLFAERIPLDFLAIGCDVNGNQLCLALVGDAAGGVWFFDHELETDPDDDTDHGDDVADPEVLIQVCGSFTELLKTIEPQPDLDEMIRRTG